MKKFYVFIDFSKLVHCFLADAAAHIIHPPLILYRFLCHMKMAT